MVLDPRQKLEGLGDYFELIYGEFADEVDISLQRVKCFLNELYRKYLEDFPLYTQEPQQSDSVGSVCSSQKSGERSLNMTEFDKRLEEKLARRKVKKAEVVITTDVEKYLCDPIVDDEISNFDILNWWRVNEHKYPTLALVARDVLAVPVSTIASESSFSTSGRVIDSYRSSLSPKMVEALICTQNWLCSTHVALHHEPTIAEIEFCEEVENGNYVC
ncbi:hypothetical protein MKX01_037563 [Papaver californicum]|nr:hypothetical protein MKX01_037563 [Papaver californicum]